LKIGETGYLFENMGIHSNNLNIIKNTVSKISEINSRLFNVMLNNGNVNSDAVIGLMRVLSIQKEIKKSILSGKGFLDFGLSEILIKNEIILAIILKIYVERYLRVFKNYEAYSRGLGIEGVAVLLERLGRIKVNIDKTICKNLKTVFTFSKFNNAKYRSKAIDLNLTIKSLLGSSEYIDSDLKKFLKFQKVVR
jgi:hypothetical protein